MKIHQTELSLLRGSVLEQSVEAIVNAANTGMRGGGALDGAIHRAAGVDMIRELEKVAPNGSKTAQVVVTGAHKLPQQWVFHVAGPVWSESDAAQCDELLAQSYRGCLLEAEKRGVESLAFPSLSTGVYGFPIERAATLALTTVTEFLEANPTTSLRSIVFVMFGGTEFYYFAKAFQNYDNRQA